MQHGVGLVPAEAFVSNVSAGTDDGSRHRSAHRSRPQALQDALYSPATSTTQVMPNRSFSIP